MSERTSESSEAAPAEPTDSGAREPAAPAPEDSGRAESSREFEAPPTRSTAEMSGETRAPSVDALDGDALVEAARDLHIPGPAFEQSPLVSAVGLLATIGLSAILVFAFGLSLRGAVSTQRASPCRPLRPELRGGIAPDFSVETLDGRTLTRDDLRGKFVILNFWATWCEPCITEWPQLARLAERFADRDDVMVLAISQDDSKDEIQAFLERMSLTGTDVVVAWDSSKQVAKAFGTDKLPDTYFVGRDSALVGAFVNVRDWGRPSAYRCVETMADQTEPAIGGPPPPEDR
ncbi:MAG: redoxin domain-containing protein [Myxococcales bacterium]|nr:redoxin domain-containing protein [Myxococcales bacterium]